MKKTILTSIFFIAIYSWNLHAQNSCGQIQISNNFENASPITEGERLMADDFIVSASTTNFSVESITANLWVNGGVESVDILFYEDNNGLPGTQIGTTIQDMVPTSQTIIGNNFGFNIYEVELNLPTPIDFAGNGSTDVTYWVQLVAVPTVPGSSVYWGMTTAGVIGNFAAFSNTTPISWDYEGFDADAVFSISGVCTFIDCPAPVNLTATATSTTSVDIAWAENGSATEWIVEYGFAGFTPGQGSLIQDNDGTLGVSLAPLSPGTLYEYYVTSICDGGMESETTGPATFTTPFCDPSNQCDYIFTLTDSFGDGWSGGEMEVRQNSTTIATLELSTGATANISVPICGGASFELFWTNGGSFSSEIGVTITDPFGTEIYNMTPGSMNPQTSLFTGTGDCTPPICPRPTNLVVSNIQENTVNLSWNSVPEAIDGYEWFVFATGDDPLTDNPIANDTTATGVLNAQATGLTPSTHYDFYVRSDCDTDGTSDLAGPVAFETAVMLTCDDIFYDDGGSFTNHEANANSTTIITPEIPGTVVTVTFYDFAVHANLDALYVYDGPNASYPLISSGNPPTSSGFPAGGYYGNTNPGPFTSTDVSGALTFVFMSDESIQLSGWEAVATCGLPRTCELPTNVAVTNVSDTTADFSWDEEIDASNGYEWFVFDSGADPETATPVATGTTVAGDLTAQATGLTTVTNYDFYVSSDCNNLGTSNLAGPIAFGTTVAAPPCGGTFYDVGGPTAPYENNASNTTTIFPTNAGDVVTVTFTHFDTQAEGGSTAYDALYVYDGPDTTYPLIDSGNPPTFSGFPAGGYYGTEIPTPFISSDPSGALTFVFMSDDAVQFSGWEAAVTCGPPPSCMTPWNPTLTTATGTTADFSWDREPNANATNGYDWFILHAGDDPDTATPVASNTTAAGILIAHATGLLPSTDYDFYVRSDCGTDGTSELAGPEFFMTAPVNDNLANAIPLTLNTPCSGDIYTNNAATLETSEPAGSCWWGEDLVQASVWFSFVAPSSGNVNISTSILPADLADSQLAVYAAPTTPGDVSTLPAAIGCNEDGESDIFLMSVLELNGLTAGDTYYIQVDGYDGAEGDFCITVESRADFYYEGGGWTPNPPNDSVNPATGSDDVSVLEGIANFMEDIEINNLTIDADATLNVQQALTVNGNIVNNGSLVFLNDPVMLGQLGDMSGSTITGSGEITVQRFIPARDDGKGAWRYLTSAVNSTQNIHANWQEGAAGINDDPNPGFGMLITGPGGNANGFDETNANDPSMFSYDNSNNPTAEYTPVPNTNMEQLMAGYPYSVYVWGDRSVDIMDSTNDPPATPTVLRATGSLLTGELSLSDLSEVAGSFNLIGNPYQAIVDMGDVMTTSINLNSAHYYVWDPNLNTRGAYATVSLPSGAATPATSDANQYLMPGQAVWVVTATNGPTTITFQENAKDVLADPTDVFRPGSTDQAYIELQLFHADRFANGQTLSDALRVNFSATGNNAVLPNDALKLPNLDENIGRMNGDNLLSIEYRNLPTDGETLALFTDQYRVENYVFRAKVNNLPEGSIAYLHDNYLGTQKELANNEITLVDFDVNETVPASIAPDRFSLTFSTDPLSVDGDNAMTKFSIYPNPVENGEFFIALPGSSGEKVAISLYNILGQKVYGTRKTMNSTERTSVPVSSLQAGVYMVELSHHGKTLLDKIIVQ